MLRHRASVLLVVGVLLGGLAVPALLALRSPAAAQDGDTLKDFQFILVETTRTDRGRNPRPSLTVYRFHEFDYRDPQFDQLEAFFEKYDEEIGIHHLVMCGFRVQDMMRDGGKSIFVVRVSQSDFVRLVRGK
jgi:hypothetical protein